MTNTEKDTAMQELQSAVEAANMAGHKVRWAAIAAREAGATWAQIGEAEGITKQRAQQKYAESVTPEAIAYRAKLATMSTAELLETSRELRERNAKTRTEREARWATENAATASIFSDTPAPAKPKTRAKKVDRPAPATSTADTARRRYLVTDPDKTAQPGTGKGPHQCPACKDTNHKTSDYGQAAFTPDCVPTKYDPPKIAALIKEKTSK